jgi:hypothetical protein
MRAVVGHEGGGERQHRVAHPEALRGGLLEHEDHALGLRHFLAEHQADFTLLGRLRDLCVDLVEADRQLRARQVGLGLLLGLRRHHERRGQGAGRRDAGTSDNSFRAGSVPGP